MSEIKTTLENNHDGKIKITLEKMRELVKKPEEREYMNEIKPRIRVIWEKDSAEISLRKK